MIKIILILYFFVNSVTELKKVTTIKEVAITGKNAKEIIMNAEDISFSVDNNIYLTDKNYYRVNVYNSDLKLIKTFGKRGKSLGEFKEPGQIDNNKKYIAIADFNSSRVQIFSKEFKPLNKFYTEGPIFDLAFDKRDNLLIGVVTGLKDKALFCYRIDGKLLSVIKLKHTSGDSFNDLFKIKIVKNGNIAIAYIYQNVIEILNKDYKFIRNIYLTKLPSHPKYKKITTNFSVPIDNLVQSVSSDNKSRIYVLAGEYSANPKREIFIYSNEGNFIGSFILPFVSYEIICDNNSNMYVIEDRRTTLKKYKLQLNF